jgi:hypothetical protein
MSKEGRFGKTNLRANLEQKEFLRGKSITQTTIGKILSIIIVCQDKTNTTSFTSITKRRGYFVMISKTSMKIMLLVLKSTSVP